MSSDFIRAAFPSAPTMIGCHGGCATQAIFEWKASSMIAVLLAAASLMQTNPAPDEELFRLVEIEVAGDSVYTIPHSIVVSVSRDDYARSRDDVTRRRWTAVRNSDRGQQTVTSDECALLSAAVAEFIALPPLSTGNTWATAAPGGSPMPPIMLHGFSTRLKWQTVDGARIETTGGYWHRQWAHNAVRDLMQCWGALIPEGSVGLPTQNPRF